MCKDKGIVKKYISLIVMCVVLAAGSAGCEAKDTGTGIVKEAVNALESAGIAQVSKSSDISPVSKSALYFDTIITITLYGRDKEKYIDSCFEIADKYEALFSKSVETSDIARINSSSGEFVSVSEDTIYILNKAHKYYELSEGKFSLVCGALTSLWDIGHSNNIPDEKEIAKAKKLVGDDMIEINEETCEVLIKEPGVKLDFGAVAKGYIADKMKEYLVNEGVESGVISLGGNILLIGNKPDGSPAANNTENKNDIGKNTENQAAGLYTIGIAKPFSDNNEMITILKLADTSVVTSGNYQRYFEKDGRIYHHIIDLTTGYPADTSLNSVSIICPSSLEADIMSTTCYLLGAEKGIRLAESLEIQSIFVSSENIILN